MLHIFNNDGVLGIVNNDIINKSNFNGVVKIDKHQNGTMTVQSFGNITTRNNEADYMTEDYMPKIICRR